MQSRSILVRHTVQRQSRGVDAVKKYTSEAYGAEAVKRRRCSQEVN